MAPTEEALLDAALALPPQNRAAIAEKLLASLGEEHRAEIDAVWAAEAERRLRGYEQGTIKTIPGGDVIPPIRPGMKP